MTAGLGLRGPHPDDTAARRTHAPASAAASAAPRSHAPQPARVPLGGDVEGEPTERLAAAVSQALPLLIQRALAGGVAAARRATVVAA